MRDRSLAVLAVFIVALMKEAERQEKIARARMARIIFDQVDTLWRSEPEHGMKMLFDDTNFRPEERDFAWGYYFYSGSYSSRPQVPIYKWFAPTIAGGSGRETEPAHRAGPCFQGDTETHARTSSAVELAYNFFRSEEWPHVPGAALGRLADAESPLAVRARSGARVP